MSKTIHISLALNDVFDDVSIQELGEKVVAVVRDVHLETVLIAVNDVSVVVEEEIKEAPVAVPE